jgi:hypothetical protein
MDIKSINLALSSSSHNPQNENLNRFKIVIAIVLIPARHAVTEIIRNSPTNNHSTKLFRKKTLVVKRVK